jgi:hypothetical protein
MFNGKALAVEIDQLIHSRLRVLASYYIRQTAAWMVAFEMTRFMQGRCLHLHCLETALFEYTFGAAVLPPCRGDGSTAASNNQILPLLLSIYSSI